MAEWQRDDVESVSDHPSYLDAFRVWLRMAGCFEEWEIRAEMMAVPDVTEEMVDQILDRGREAEEQHRGQGYKPKFVDEGRRND